MGVTGRQALLSASALLLAAPLARSWSGTAVIRPSRYKAQ